MKRFIVVVALLWASVTNAQLIGPGAGGSSFNPASPGNIGTTTPGTAQFTSVGVNQAAPVNGLSITAPASSVNGSLNIVDNASDFGRQIQSTENGNGTVEIFDSTATSSIRMHNGATAFQFNEMSDTNTDATLGSNGFSIKGFITSPTAAAISGGGALATGSNSFAGRITGLAATSNILTPGFTCTNAVTCAFEDDTTVGGVKVTAQGTTTITFSATASDTADYVCGCR